MKKVSGTTLVFMGSGLLILALVLKLQPAYQAVLLVGSIVLNLIGIVKNIRDRRKNQL